MAGSNTFFDIALERATWEKIGTFTPGNVHSRGSVILIRKDILGPGTTIEHEEIFPGGDHLVRFRQLDCSCTVINLHYQPEGTLQELRQRLRAAAAMWPTYPDGVGFLVGDFNICDRDEGRLNSRNQAFIDGDTSRAAALLAASSRSVEIAQPYFTRKDDRRDGSIHTLSRIDRIFINLPTAELRDFPCHTHTVASIGDKSVPSDHFPVRLAIECLRMKQQDHLVIWRWIAQHPLFISAPDEEHRTMMYDVDPFTALDQFKEVAFRARSKARQAILTNTPTTLGAKLHVACVALRAYRSGLTATIKQCCETWAPVARCFDFQFTE